MSIDTLFGHGDRLDALQLCMRAWVVFSIALVLVRIGGMRAFGRKSSFDTIVAFMLGAVLSRAVVGASPFVPTVLACLVLVVVHRLLAIATAAWPWLEHVVKGQSQVVYRQEMPDLRALRRSGISLADLDEAVRSHANYPGRREVAAIWLESSGELTVIERP